MTEQQVINLVGQPTKSELTSCGGRACKSWFYGEFPAPMGAGKVMTIYFGENGAGEWLVISWTVT